MFSVFTITGIVLFIIVLVTVFIRRNEIRTAAITLMTIYLVLAMTFGYTAARHHAVDSFDKHGEQIARQMIHGVDAYYDALVDLRIGNALVYLGLLILVVTSRRKS